MLLTLLQSSGAGPGVITGNLAAAESGADTAALAGVVLVQGSVAAQESGEDVFSCEGVVPVRGTLSVTETGEDAFSCEGIVPVRGTLSVTEAGSDTFEASGTEAPSEDSRVPGKTVAGGPGTQILLSEMRRKPRIPSSVENDDEEAIALLLCALASSGGLRVNSSHKSLMGLGPRDIPTM